MSLTLIDGEIGTQLLNYGPEPQDDPLWCSRFNITNPQAVYQCYLDFMAAGCQIIRTNSYQSSVAGFKEHLNLGQQQCEELFHEIVDLAQKARNEFVTSLGENQREIKVWASVGSYGAYLHDGSEYTGSFLDVTNKEKIKEFHKERLDILLVQSKLLGKELVDGVAVETIPSVEEALLVVELFNENYPGVKYWISFNCKVSFCFTVYIKKL